MKEKHLKILAGIFVFLLIIYFVTKPRLSGVDISELVQSVVIGVSKDNVYTVEVYKETGEDEPIRMIFSKADDEWRIPTYFTAKAQKYRMDNLLDNILEMTGKVRSEDPRHHAQYKITDVQGIHLLIKDEADKPLANLIIGKKPEDETNGFVRFAGRDQVYFTDKNLLSDLGIYGDADTLSEFSQKSFVELQAIDRKPEDLELIGLVKDGVEMVIKKNEKEVEKINEADSTTTFDTETEWVLLQDQREIALDQDEVDKFIRDVTKIRATELVDRIGGSFADMNKAGQYGVGRPRRVLVFKAPEGPQENVIFGKTYDDDAGVYMQVQYDFGLVYKLSKSTYDKIFKWVEELPKKKVD